MYAIIEDGGKQYKVEPGQTLSVELRDLNEGHDDLQFERVLFLRDGEETTIGQPLVTGAKVLAKIAGLAAGPKLNIMQRKRRKNSKRRVGHRQKYLDVEITEIKKA